MDRQRLNFQEFGALDNESLRSVNESIVLNLIREKQPISRVELAGLTNLKESTISSIAKSLLDEDLIYEADLGNSSGGRKPRMLRINGNRCVGIGIDVGIRETVIGLGNFNGEILYKKILRTHSDPHRFVPRLVEEIDATIRRTVPSGVKMEGLGISLPGLLDRSKGTIIYSANLDWREVELGAALRRTFDYEMMFEDNVNSAALAEIWFGSPGGLKEYHLVNLVVNEGLGAGLIIGGRLYRGSALGAGQFGHVSIDPNGPVCGCGNRGCWELYGSDTATIKRYLKAIGSGGDSNSLTVAELGRRASKGDRLAVRVIRETGEYLGIGLAVLVNTLNPELIVLDGEIGQSWALIEPEVWRALRVRALGQNLKSLRIKPSSMNENPCLLGALSLVICRRFSVPRRSRPVDANAVTT